MWTKFLKFKQPCLPGFYAITHVQLLWASYLTYFALFSKLGLRASTCIPKIMEEMSVKVAQRGFHPANSEEISNSSPLFFIRGKYSDRSSVDKRVFRIPGNEPLIQALIKINFCPEANSFVKAFGTLIFFYQLFFNIRQFQIKSEGNLSIS